MTLVTRLQKRPIDELTGPFVSEIEREMNELNEASQSEMDERVDELARDME